MPTKRQLKYWESLRGKSQKNNRTHGKCGSRVYASWRSMKSRCFNKKELSYKYYGGRGISVCKEWLDFNNFYHDMGERPKGKTLNRIDGSRNYETGNCNWVTPKEQANNRRRNRLISYKGKTMTVMQLSEKLKVNYFALLWRVNKGYFKKLSTEKMVDSWREDQEMDRQRFAEE